MEDQKQEAIHDTVAKENEQASASMEQKFDFITETIKRKPINKKRLLGKFLWNVFSAVVFGVIVCLVFIILRPHFENLIHPKDSDATETKVVTIPKDAEETEETDPAERTDGKAAEAEAEKKDEKPQEVVTQVVQKVEKVEKNLDISDYKHLYQKINLLASDARKSLVTVTGVYSDVDWFMNPYEENERTSGLIIADNGKEFLIIAQTKAIKNAQDISVTFCNGTECAAVIKKSDAETGLSIIGVDMQKIDEKTMAEINEAKLGSSAPTTLVGTPVIALGNPIGVADSAAHGFITSNSYVKTMTDSSVRFLTTDIFGSTQASGVLLDLDGYVLGIIYPEKTVGAVQNMVKAYGISDLKGKIEKLSNGQDLAYLGILGTDVTDSAAEELGIPRGAYVKEVQLDSPAMEAGIQNGDIIVKLGTSEITSFDTFKNAMLRSQPGDLMMVTVMRQGVDAYREHSYEVKLGTQTTQ